MDIQFFWLFPTIIVIIRITYTERADFLVDGKYRIAVCGEGEGQKFDSSLVVMEDMIERGKGNIMPLWLAGFTY